MNTSQKAKWERTRAKGFWRFVLLSGVVMSGAMIIAVAVFDYFTSPQGFTLEHLKIRVPIFLVGGFAAGAVIWFIGEYLHKKNFGSAS